MIRLGFLKCLVFSVAACLFSCGCAFGFRGEKGQKYGRVVFGGYDTAKRSDVCLAFNVSMTSGDFFDGLERRDTSGGSIFYKDSKRVDYFPDEVTLDVRIDTAKCNNGSSGALPSIDASDVVKSLQFDPAWKTGSTIVSAEAISMELLEGRKIKVGRQTWYCSILIRSKGVHLTSHLLVTIRSSQTEMASRVSVYL